MKRYSLGLVVVAMILVLGSMASAKFPDPNKPDSSATFTVQQGFAPNGNLLWFFCTDTSDINFASTIQFPFRTPTLSGLLSSAYQSGKQPTAGRKMYINVCYQQGPLFNVLPGDSAYAGVWSVVFIKFLPGQARRVCNITTWDAINNPEGFPITSGPGKQADLLATYGTTRSGAVLDCPIVAVGPFPKTGPWFPGGNANSNPYAFYRLQQVLAYNAYYKTVTLPAYYVYCQEWIKRYIDKCTVIIPDVQDATLAARLKANLAPGLNGIDDANKQNFYFIDGRIYHDGPAAKWFKNGGPVGPLQNVNQFPIIEQCPTGHGAQQFNPGYTPIMDVELLEAGLNYPLDPLNKMICFVNNAEYAEFLINAGIFTVVDDKSINAPVLDCVRILPPGGQCCIP